MWSSKEIKLFVWPFWGASTPVPSSSPPALLRRARRSRNRRCAPRSAPTAREISRNNQGRLHQLSQGLCCMRLLRSAFRAIARARDASGDVSSSPARAEGAPPSAPQVPSAAGLPESANSGVLDGALPATGASPGRKRLVQQVFESTTHGSNHDLAHFLLNMTQLVHVLQKPLNRLAVIQSRLLSRYRY